MCRWLIWGFTGAYAVALVLLIIATYGLFGNQRDPLAGVFLIPLGLPWVLWIDGLPEGVLPVAAALAPLVNLAVIVGICRALRGR
jgi:hypothetical protein